MTQESVLIHDPAPRASSTDPQPWYEAGSALGRAHECAEVFRKTRFRDRNLRRQLRALVAHAAAKPDDTNATWILDNVRLILGAQRGAAELAWKMRGYPVLRDSSGAYSQRIRLVAREYLLASQWCFTEQNFTAFVDGYQGTAGLAMQELLWSQAALQVELVGRLAESGADEWPALVTSLRKVADTPWKDLFESISSTHRALTRDPAGIYSRMDFDSRERYRKVIAHLARCSPRTETEIADAAIALSEQMRAVSDGSRAAVRRTHVGYYLVDRGRACLESAIEYQPSFRARIQQLILRHPTAFYLGGIELLTLLIVFAILSRVDSIAPLWAALLLLLLPATQAAVDFINHLTTSLIPPRSLPKLDFSAAIPDDCVTMVAVPALLMDPAQVHDLVLDLEIRFLANRDRNLYFALLTDCPDADTPIDERDELVGLCIRLIEGLNQRYGQPGRSPFFLFHRHRAYNRGEGRWIGWERKRGKLLDLNELLRGGSDAFPVKVGDLSVLRGVRYVITLDADTQLPRDSAARLIGAIAHPLNQAVVDPDRRVVVEGYGILQPRMGISVQSASRSRLARLYSGQTGFDIYTRAVSDVYQDLFGKGSFTGKGIYEVDTLLEVLNDRFPENALLSHDLIEGAHATAALVSDIELIDDYPSHFSAYSRRRHRWLRGDWQIVRWILPRVPGFDGRLVHNPISLISQWKILDNLRRSLLEPTLVLLLLSGWLWLPGRPAYWTAAAVLMWCLPVLSDLFFSLLRVPQTWRAVPPWIRASFHHFRDNALMAMCSLIFLLHQAIISTDAVIRAIVRAFVTKKKLLEWETAAEAENAAGRKTAVDTYLEWTPWLAIAIAASIGICRHTALPAASPFLVLWALSRSFSNWLNRRPRTSHNKLSELEVQLLRESADRIWRFFHDWSSSATNWLIPDSVREDGTFDSRLSPTNLGMLLNARIAALHMGVLPVAEFVFETQQTLDRILELPKYRGHLLNWYDIHSLEPVRPWFVSTVDSGNLAISLWTLKQAALALASEPAGRRGVTAELGADLRTIAEESDRLVREMDFRFLYQPRRAALSIGFDVGRGRLETVSYDLLASEARIASFVAIAKGDIPQESWFRLGRSHTVLHGERALLSWSGTMFEYLMPSLWMRHYPDTVLGQSMKAAVRAQREYGRCRGVPWGISESAFLSGLEGEYGYKAFGLPELALQRNEDRALVIAPYSTFLAAAIDPSAAAENLRQMEQYGWFGRYGFYEAVDYTKAGGEAIRMWMAHHQGMSLLALVNLLYDNPLPRYLHAEPAVLATELLLHERLPSGVAVEVDPLQLLRLQPSAA